MDSTADVLCRIMAGDLPAEVVWRDTDLIAFLDHRPVFKGHALVCPTQHVAGLTELPDALVAPLFTLVRRVAGAMVTGLGAQGSFSGINTTISQSIPHLHVHVIPRSHGDGLRGFFWPRVRYADDEAAAYAGRLRAALR
ncbi:MAG: HIT family protein [Propionicimonas sp.]